MVVVAFVPCALAAKPHRAVARHSSRAISRGKAKTKHGRHAGVVRARKVAPIAEPAQAPLAPIEVHHDRKQHRQRFPAGPPPGGGVQPVAYRRGRMVVPPAMKESWEILLRQNEIADSDGLNRVGDQQALAVMVERKELVTIPVTDALRVDGRLEAGRRYCRPWTGKFLTAMAKAHWMRFHTPMQVNSAVRTVDFQMNLRRVNGNAAPAEGDTASPHLTGQAVDLAKHGLSVTEIAWMRGYLLPLVQQGKIDVEEEFQQACFHVSVYKKYAPEASAKRTIQPARKAVMALAVAVP